MRRRSSHAVARWGLASALAALLGAPAGATPTQERREVGKISLIVPIEAVVTEQPADDETVQIVGVTMGDEDLVITIYTGERAPTQNKALAVHAEELERKVSEASTIETFEFKQRMLGRARPGRAVRFTASKREFTGRVVAAAQNHRTVVASWVSSLEFEQTRSPNVVASIELH